MASFFLRVLAMLLVTASLGCGGDRGNQVVETPTMTPEEQQKAYDDYDRQAAESVPNP